MGPLGPFSWVHVWTTTQRHSQQATATVNCTQTLCIANTLALNHDAGQTKHTLSQWIQCVERSHRIYPAMHSISCGARTTAAHAQEAAQAVTRSFSTTNAGSYWQKQLQTGCITNFITTLDHCNKTTHISHAVTQTFRFNLQSPALYTTHNRSALTRKAQSTGAALYSEGPWRLLDRHTTKYVTLMNKMK